MGSGIGEGCWGSGVKGEGVSVIRDWGQGKGGSLCWEREEVGCRVKDQG